MEIYWTIIIILFIISFILVIWSLYPRYDYNLPRRTRAEIINAIKQVPIGTNIGIYVEEISEESLIPKWKVIICKRAGKPAFLVGERYLSKFKITNIGPRNYRGGRIYVQVKWTSGRTDYWYRHVPPLDIDETSDEISLNFGVIEPWYGTMHIESEERNIGYPQTFSPTKPFMFTSERYYSKDELQFSSVFGQEDTIFYTFWALVMAVAGLWYRIIKDLISFIF